jgi:mono/diheme cytochrome c family protein
MRTLIALCAAVLVSGGVYAAQGTAKPAAGAAEKGQQLYASNKCQTCHAIQGKGNAKGALDCVGDKLSAEELRQWLINPREMTGKTNATRKPPMPPYAKLSTADIDAMIAYMQTLKCKK